MRVRLFVEFSMEDDTEHGCGVPGGITNEMRTKAAKECVRNAMRLAYEEGAEHSLSHCCTIGPALVFGARVVHNNSDVPSAARAREAAVECQLREDELARAKSNAEMVLQRMARSAISPIELNMAYAAFDALIYPLTGQHVSTDMGT